MDNKIYFGKVNLVKLPQMNGKSFQKVKVVPVLIQNSTTRLQKSMKIKPTINSTTKTNWFTIEDIYKGKHKKS